MSASAILDFLLPQPQAGLSSTRRSGHVAFGSGVFHQDFRRRFAQGLVEGPIHFQRRHPDHFQLRAAAGADQPQPQMRLTAQPDLAAAAAAGDAGDGRRHIQGGLITNGCAIAMQSLCNWRADSPPRYGGAFLLWARTSIVVEGEEVADTGNRLDVDRAVGIGFHLLAQSGDQAPPESASAFPTIYP